MGSSVVEKSTIINTLVGKEAMGIGDINESTSKGRHTTARRELILLNNGTVLLDTPDMREFGVMVDEIDSETFSEILEWSKYCEFSNCQHHNEKGCAVKEAVANGKLS